MALTRSRRIVCDLLHFARRVPAVVAERTLDLAPVALARRAPAQRPCWYAILARAHALVCRDEGRLRRCYRPFPWPHLYQHEASAATLPISRVVDGEEGLLFLTIQRPEEETLAGLHARIMHASTAPLAEVSGFHTQLRIAGLPWPLRRLAWWLAADFFPGWRLRHLGTFGVTGVAGTGADTPFFLSPLTTNLTMGVIGRDGRVPVRLVYDHRVIDARLASRSLSRLEEVLRGQIAAELRAMADNAKAA
jgi:hypothetical protein